MSTYKYCTTNITKFIIFACLKGFQLIYYVNEIMAEYIVWPRNLGPNSYDAFSEHEQSFIYPTSQYVRVSRGH